MPDHQRRWSDSTKVVWGLFAAIGFLIAALGSMAWGVIQANGNGIHSNGERITEVEKLVPVVQEQYKGIVGRLTRIEKKIDNGR